MNVLRKKSIFCLFNRLIRYERSARDPAATMVSALSLSDKDFLALFDLNSISYTGELNDTYAVQEKVLKHYRKKTKADWPLPPGTITDLDLELDKLENRQLIFHADAILRHQFSTAGARPIISPEGLIEWHANPISNFEWLWWLHRHAWWPVLGKAFWVTGDERYSEAFVSQMLDWIEKNPPPQGKNEKSPSWRLMETGLRLRISWVPAFGAFYGSAAFNDNAKMIMLRSIYDHARFLSMFKSRKNHLLRESNGLAYAGVYFQEFKEAGLWRQKAFERFDRELVQQINDDGSQIEVSIGYQWLVVDEFEIIHELLSGHDLKLPKNDLKLWLEKMYRVLAYTIRPDGTFPQINDGFIHWSFERLAKAGKMLDRPDFTFIGTVGIEGEKPSATSIAFKNAGWYVMRSDWAEDAKYLFFDAGPYGGHHGHEDKLSIEVFASRQAFIVDSGSYTYESDDPFRNYFVSSLGHNTALVDGLSQIRRWKKVNMKPRTGEGDAAIWRTNAAFDFVAASYNEGYGSFHLKRPKKHRVIQDVTHTRRILFVKPDYWLILDEFNASAQHDYQLLFHTDPDVRVSANPDNKVTLHGAHTDARLLMIPLEPDAVHLSCQTGSESPIQGWYSSVPHIKHPATAVIYERKNCASTVIGTLLYPVPSMRKGEHINVGKLPVRGAKAVALEVNNDKGKDILMISLEPGLTYFDDYQSGADIFGVRLNHKGSEKIRFEGHFS